MDSPLDTALVGMVLADRYRIDRLVGRGGFGVVFAGHHVALDIPIAVKVLDLHEAGSAARRRAESLAREAQTLAQLRHPHIARVLDSSMRPAEGDLPELFYLVLEWCEGPTLSEHLAERSGPGSRSASWRLFQPIVDAVAHAHDHGVVHRDLKPDNIILVEGSPRVLDFGIAKVMDDPGVPSDGSRTESEHRAFTPAYAAPEQVSGLRTGPWTDVHALGLILTELLVGRRAYQSTGGAELLRETLDEQRPTPATHGVDAGPWEAVIAKALRVSPTERQSNARGLARELARSAPSLDTSPSDDVPLGPPPSLALRATEESGAASKDKTLEPTTASSWRPARPALAAVAVIAGAVAAYWLLAPPAEEPTAPVVPSATAGPLIPTQHPIDDYSLPLLVKRLEEGGFTLTDRDEQTTPASSLVRVVAERNEVKAFISVQRWAREIELASSIEALSATEGVIERKQSALLFVQVVGDGAASRRLAETLAAGGEAPPGPVVAVPGSRWEHLAAPTRAHLRAVHEDGDAIYIAGHHGVILRYDGDFTREETPITGDLHDIWGRGDGELFAVGPGGLILHRVEGRWQRDETEHVEDFHTVGGNRQRTIILSHGSILERTDDSWARYDNDDLYMDGFACAVVGEDEALAVVDTKGGVGLYRSTEPGRWERTSGWPESGGLPWPFVRSTGTVFRRPGAPWAQFADDRGWRPEGFAQGPGELVLVGSLGIILSLDASMIATAEPSGTEDDLHDAIRTRDGTFYVVGDHGVVLRRR